METVKNGTEYKPKVTLFEDNCGATELLRKFEVACCVLIDALADDLRAAQHTPVSLNDHLNLIRALHEFKGFISESIDVEI